MREDRVDLSRDFVNAMEFVPRCSSDSDRVVVVDERIVEFVALVRYFKNRRFKLRAFGHSEPFAERACGDVPHDHFERNDFHFSAEHFAVGKFFNKMRRHVP